MSANRYALRAIGVAFSTTDYCILGNIEASHAFKRSLSSQELKRNDVMANELVNMLATYTLDCKFKQLNTSLLTRFLGGSVAAGGYFYKKEKISRSSHTYTLTNGSGGTESSLYIAQVYDITNKTYRKKDSSAVAGTSYTLSGKILTVNASDTAADMEIIYFYKDSATTDGKIIIPPNSVPSECGMLLSWEVYEVGTGAVTGGLVMEALRCLPTGDIALGGDPQSFIEIPAQFRIQNIASGDLAIYPNNLFSFGW